MYSINACLSADGGSVITDLGVYHLTGDELNDEALALAAASVKCRLAYDSGWFTRRHWLDQLTANTVLD